MISKQAICLGGELVVLAAELHPTHLWSAQIFAIKKQIVYLLSGVPRKKNAILTRRHTRLADHTSTSNSAAGRSRKLSHAHLDMMSKQAICLGGVLVVLADGLQLTHLWYVQIFAVQKTTVCLLSGVPRKTNAILTQRPTRLADLTATSNSAAGRSPPPQLRPPQPRQPRLWRV